MLHQTNEDSCAMTHSLPTLADLNDVLSDEQACLDWLIAQDILETPTKCSKCGGVDFKRVKKSRQYRCTWYQCRAGVSVLDGTFFTGRKLPLHTIMCMAYFFLMQAPRKLIMTVSGVSTRRASKYTAEFRLLIAEHLEDDDTLIGGPGIIVEIDESKFGKRKNHRGHQVDGSWVLGGVERTDERKVFLQRVDKRDRRTLMEVIQKHVRSGSIVYTDCWKAYNCLTPRLGLEHKTVNHSLHFKDPKTGVHTNSIEGTWNKVKMNIAPRSYSKAIINI